MADHLLPRGSGDPPERQSVGPVAPVIVIGRADTLTLAEASVPGGPVYLVPVGGLDAALLARVDPGWVIFPLMASDFDAPMVIEKLAELGYSGRACVVAPPLPNRRMVEIELRSIAPILHLMLVERPA
jgi:hypothetical protein